MRFREEPVTPVYRHWMCEQVGCNGELLSTGEGITRLSTRWRPRRLGGHDLSPSRLPAHWPCGIGAASCRRRTARLVLRCARVARPVGAVGINVERPRGTLDDFFRDHDHLDAFEARS